MFSGCAIVDFLLTGRGPDAIGAPLPDQARPTQTWHGFSTRAWDAERPVGGSTWKHQVSPRGHLPFRVTTRMGYKPMPRPHTSPALPRPIFFSHALTILLQRPQRVGPGDERMPDHEHVRAPLGGPDR